VRGWSSAGSGKARPRPVQLNYWPWLDANGENRRGWPPATAPRSEHWAQQQAEPRTGLPFPPTAGSQNWPYSPKPRGAPASPVENSSHFGGLFLPRCAVSNTVVGDSSLLIRRSSSCTENRYSFVILIVLLWTPYCGVDPPSGVLASRDRNRRASHDRRSYFFTGIEHPAACVLQSLPAPDLAPIMDSVDRLLMLDELDQSPRTLLAPLKCYLRRYSPIALPRSSPPWGRHVFLCRALYSNSTTVTAGRESMVEKNNSSWTDPNSPSPVYEE